MARVTPVSVAALVDRIRRDVNDYGTTVLTLTAAMDTTQTTFAFTPDPPSELVQESSRFICELEQIEVTATYPWAVRRGINATTAAIHAIGTRMYMEPRFTNQEILDALNEAVRILSGYVPKRGLDEEQVVLAGTEEYEAPTGAFAIESLDVETDTSGYYRPWVMFEIIDYYSPPKIRILGYPPAGRGIRLGYLGPYTEFTWTTPRDVLDEIPAIYHSFLVDFAHGELLIKEGLKKADLVGEAIGGKSTVSESLTLGQTLQSRALGKLTTVRPTTRIIRRPSSRSYRL
jgi:hypothetical protein